MARGKNMCLLLKTSGATIIKAMKITVNELRKIIKEEIIREMEGAPRTMAQEVSDEDAAILEFIKSKGLKTANLDLSLSDTFGEVTLSDGSKSVDVSAREIYEQTGNTLVQLAYSIDALGGNVLDAIDAFEEVDAAQTYV